MEGNGEYCECYMVGHISGHTVPILTPPKMLTHSSRTSQSRVEQSQHLLKGVAIGVNIGSDQISPTPLPPTHIGGISPVLVGTYLYCSYSNLHPCTLCTLHATYCYFPSCQSVLDLPLSYGYNQIHLPLLPPWSALQNQKPKPYLPILVRHFPDKHLHLTLRYETEHINYTEPTYNDAKCALWTDKVEMFREWKQYHQSTRKRQ